MIGDNLEQYTFAFLMNTALSHVPDSMDKREGSVIYDALGPACHVLAMAFMELRNVYIDTFADTATGEALDLRTQERYIVRQAATPSIRRADFEDADGHAMVIPIGSRFSSVSSSSPIIYVVTGEYKEGGVPVAGAYELTCETAGVIGNRYSGNLISISFIQGLSVANLSTILIPGEDEETDEELRERYFENIKNQAFGGNIAQYRQELSKIEGIGQVQVYPVWDGPGTVKCCIVGPDNDAVSDEFIASVKAEVDPQDMEGHSGTGLGIAPIGHDVTIATVSPLSVDISCDVSIDGSYSPQSVKAEIVESISNYIDNVRGNWSHSDSFNRYYLSVYRSQIMVSILSVPGVLNVTDILLNGDDEDIYIQQTGDTQYMVELGEVVIND